MKFEKQKYNEFEAEEALKAELGAEATGQVVSVELIEPEKELPLQEAA